MLAKASLFDAIILVTQLQRELAETQTRTAPVYTGADIVLTNLQELQHAQQRRKDEERWKSRQQGLQAQIEYRLQQENARALQRQAEIERRVLHLLVYKYYGYQGAGMPLTRLIEIRHPGGLRAYL